LINKIISQKIYIATDGSDEDNQNGGIMTVITTQSYISCA